MWALRENAGKSMMEEDCGIGGRERKQTKRRSRGGRAGEKKRKSEDDAPWARGASILFWAPRLFPWPVCNGSWPQQQSLLQAAGAQVSAEETRREDARWR
eukprot:1281702-Rhodomonas_salina.1